jgi:hypothetical protein
VSDVPSGFFDHVDADPPRLGKRIIGHATGTTAAIEPRDTPREHGSRPA